MVRLTAISDAHLGAPYENPEKLKSFLSTLSREDNLILCGDIFDLWNSTNGDPFIKHAEILGRFYDLRAVYVLGNHDLTLRHFVREDRPHPLRLCRSYMAGSGGKRFFFCHGYELEVFSQLEPMTIAGYESFSEKMCYARKKLVNLANAAFDIVMTGHDPSRLMLTAKGRHDSDTVLKFAESGGGAVVYGLNPGDWLVFGHLHCPYYNPASFTPVVNTGQFTTNGRCTYVTIKDGDVALNVWK
jgi:UDP-2,3-diacylglucosamine pyrophosphatase LpxH